MVPRGDHGMGEEDRTHVCVRTYVMTASASADLKELPLLRSSFDMIQKFVCFVSN